ncbi:MAG: hypothetical protein Q7U55_03325, partial [Deltaproteobacteria bacterium]|nr:hypothetical protein [Deltaproteobacteria bacterium]
MSRFIRLSSFRCWYVVIVTHELFTPSRRRFVEFGFRHPVDQRFHLFEEHLPFIAQMHGYGGLLRPVLDDGGIPACSNSLVLILPVGHRDINLNDYTGQLEPLPY